MKAITLFATVFVLAFGASFGVGLCLEPAAVAAPVADAGAPDAPQIQHIPALKCQSRPCVAQMVLEGEVVGETEAVMNAYLDIVAKANPDAYSLVINSPGGSFEVGRRMYRRLVSLDKPLFCYVQDNAQSVAFWLLQACTVRFAAPEASLMIHEVKVVLDGIIDANTALAIANDLMTSTDIMATHVSKRMGMPKSQFLSRIARGDWSMSGTEALRFKAVDVIITGGPAEYKALIIHGLAAAPPN